MDVGELAGRDEDDGHGQQIGGGDPAELDRVHPQIGLDGRQGDIDRRDHERADERGQRGDDQGRPFEGGVYLSWLWLHGAFLDRNSAAAGWMTSRKSSVMFREAKAIFTIIGIMTAGGVIFGRDGRPPCRLHGQSGEMRDAGYRRIW